MGKKFKNNSDECGTINCDGGMGCWKNTNPSLDICAKCTCLTCTKGHCPPSDLERQKKETKYQTPQNQPSTINLPCGCELSKVRQHKKKIGGINNFYYVVTGFCEDHDPSLWANYDDDDKYKASE